MILIDNTSRIFGPKQLKLTISLMVWPNWDFFKIITSSPNKNLGNIASAILRFNVNTPRKQPNAKKSRQSNALLILGESLIITCTRHTSLNSLY